MGISDTEATDTAGANNDEVQTVTLSNVDDGTFRLAFEGETTAELADGHGPSNNWRARIFLMTVATGLGVVWYVYWRIAHGIRPLQWAVIATA